MNMNGAPRTDGGSITCGFCGRDFFEDRAQPACQSCPLAQACRFVRCPHCGYDNPLNPAWVERLGTWMRSHVSA